MPFASFEKPAKEPKVLIAGPSGSGKTHWSLQLARASAGEQKIALLDTESGRGRLFKVLTEYDYEQMGPPFAPALAVERIHEAVAEKYGALVMDSLTMFWNDEGGVLDMVRSAGGNTFTDGWGRVGTPAQKLLMGSIVRAPIPIVCTVRTKVDYVVEQNEKGKVVPKKVGMAKEQRDNAEYDFDVVVELDMDHTGRVTKAPPIPGLPVDIAAGSVSAFARQLVEWMRDGVAEVYEPQTWEELKYLVDDEELIAQARQWFKKSEIKTPAEAWARLRNGHGMALTI